MPIYTLWIKIIFLSPGKITPCPNSFPRPPFPWKEFWVPFEVSVVKTLFLVKKDSNLELALGLASSPCPTRLSPPLQDLAASGLWSTAAIWTPSRTPPARRRPPPSPASCPSLQSRGCALPCHLRRHDRRTHGPHLARQRRRVFPVAPPPCGQGDQAPPPLLPRYQHERCADMVAINAPDVVHADEELVPQSGTWYMLSSSWYDVRVVRLMSIVLFPYVGSTLLGHHGWALNLVVGTVDAATCTMHTGLASAHCSLTTEHG